MTTWLLYELNIDFELVECLDQNIQDSKYLSVHPLGRVHV